MTARAQTVTILFTDLVGSTELLQRAGDEQAQRIFKAHHRLLREAVEAHDGHEVKWLGDGLMVAFDSALDAVKCAIVMQQSSRRPTAGERLEIRAGLHVGEAFVDESDYFGTAVVIARRLCDKGNAGQILASDMVVRLLEGRGTDIKSNDLGPLELKGITNAVPAVEIVYQHDPMALLRKLPFVGRAAEYETMLKKLAEARNGRGAVVLLAGEPGIGKTRLTEEFCEHASSGATVIRGNCYEGDGTAPFGPWTEALRSLIDQTPSADLRDTLGPGAPDIAVMMPEIRKRLPDLEEAPRLDPESERARLFESISAFLRNAAEKRPLVIFFDDLHWCDRPSLALLEHVARGIADRRIVIVGTYRDVEVDRVHPLAQTLAALRRMEHHERIAIRGFTQESVYDLLNAIEPSEQAEEAKRGLAQVLHAEAEGNPFFIREVLSNLIETGNLAQQNGVWTGTVTSIEDFGIPEGIKEVIGRRMSRLTQACNKMLQRASAMTSGFTWDELRAICGDPEDELLDALDEALGAQLIAERSRNTYAFTHALIRATLYGELSTPRRVLLHRRIGEALEKLYASSIEAHLPELAHHFYEAASAGDVDKAIEYASRAGHRAAELYAWEEAATHYERALQTMELLPTQDEHRQVEILLALGEALAGGGDRKGYREAFARAAGVARRTGDAKAFARSALGFASPFNSAGAFDPQLIGLLEEALDLLPAEDSALRAMVMARRAHARLVVGPEPVTVDGRKALAMAEDEALAMARRVGDKTAITYALGININLVVADVYARGEDLAGLIDEAMRLAQETGNKWEQIACCRSRVALSITRGERDVIDAAGELAERLEGELRTGGLTSHVRAMQARLDGRFDAAESLARQGLVEARRLYPGVAPAFFGAQLFDLRRAQGRLGELESACERAATQFPSIPVYRALLTRVYEDQNRHEEARALFNELATEDFAAFDHTDGQWPFSLAMLAEVCCYLNDELRAAVLYEQLLSLAKYCIAFGLASGSTGSASAPLGALAATLGRFDAAERHFEDAIAMNRKLRAPTWVADTQCNYGDMLLRRARPGDRDRAVALLNEALAFARESGMGKVERDSERLLASADS